MGITVHYEGTLRSERDLEAVLGLVRGEADAAGWAVEDVASDDATLERVIDEEERDYKGRVRGLVVRPHEEAEPLHFVFGDDLFMQDYCKTQFAGVETHIAVVALLRKLAPHFRRLDVIDDGELWDTRDVRRLRALMEGFDKALAVLVAEHPGARVKIRLPSGRIIDAIE